jgi:hypothetical protein
VRQRRRRGSSWSWRSIDVDEIVCCRFPRRKTVGFFVEVVGSKKLGEFVEEEKSYVLMVTIG